MFKNLRLRLTLGFVVFSFIAYIVTTIATRFLLHNQLTIALDNELNELIAENLKEVGYSEGHPFFVIASSDVQARPEKMLASIQLFDTNGSLLYQLGQPGIVKHYEDVKEVSIHSDRRLRIRSQKLYRDGTLI